jgi:tetratricopeptide (TPR) repeat protein
MLKRLAAVIIVAVAMAGVPALANDLDDCLQADPDRSIRGCTSIINAGGYSPGRRNFPRSLHSGDRGIHVEALQAFLVGQGYDPGNVDGIYGVGTQRALQAFRVRQSSRGSLRDILDRSVKELTLSLAYATRGVHLNDKGKFDEAFADLDKAIRTAPGFALGYTMRGYAHSVKGDYDKGFADLDKAIQISPSLAAAYSFRGYAHSGTGDYDKAFNDLDKAIKLDPTNAFAFAFRGMAHISKDDTDNAFIDLDKAIKLDPTNAFALAFRGIAHISKDDTDKAFIDLDKAIKLHPTNVFAYTFRGLAHAANEDYGKAFVDFDKALQIYPNHPYAYYARSLVFDEKGDPAKALVDLKVALRLAPTGGTLKTLILADISEIERKLTNPGKLTSKPTLRQAPAPAPAEPSRRVFSAGDGAVVTVTVREIDGQMFNVVSVEGDFKPGDDKSFKQALLTVDGAVVVSFESPGGDLDAGMEIGRTIWTNQFMTVVEDGTCASACALAWLAGRPRYATRNANIGFHAPTRTDDPDRLADSVGSAFVGGYLTELGFTDAAIAYINEPGPDEMNWLSFEKARGLGIYVEDWQ